MRLKIPFRQKFRALRDRWNPDLSAVTLIIVVTAVVFAPLLFNYTFSMVGAHMYSLYPWAANLQYASGVVGVGYTQTDHAEWVYPSSVFVTEAVRNGELPLWLPYNFGGIPALDYDMVGFRYPLRWPLILLLSPGRQHDLLLLTHLLIAGLGMYALLRCLGAEILGAAFGAMVWELNGNNAFWLILEHAPIAAAWLPLTLLTAILAVRRQSCRWAAAAGIAAGLFTLSGYLHYVYFGGLILICCYGWVVIFKVHEFVSRREWRKSIYCLSLPLCSLLIAMAVSASLWLPFFKGLDSIHRRPATFSQQVAEGLPWPAVLKAQFMPEGAMPLRSGLPDFTGCGLVGLASLLLSLLAVLWRRSAAVISSFALLIIAVGIITGWAPLYRLLRAALPYFGTFHASEGFLLFCFAAAILSGIGLSQLTQWYSAKRKPWYGSAVAGLITIAGAQLIIAAGAILSNMAPKLTKLLALKLPDFYEAGRVVYNKRLRLDSTEWLIALTLTAIALGACALLVRGLKRKKIFYHPVIREIVNKRPILVYALLLTNTIILIIFFWAATPMHPAQAKYFFPATPVIKELQNLQKDSRVIPVNQHLPADQWRPPMLLGKTTALFGLRSGSGYENLLPDHIARVWWTVQSGGKPNDASLFSYRSSFRHDELPIGLLEKLSVRLLVTQPGIEPQDVNGRNPGLDGRLKPVYRGDDGWIYENPRALPRAFLVPKVITVSDPENALRTLSDPEFDARQAAIIIGQAPAECAELWSNSAPLDQHTSGRTSGAKIVSDGLNDVEIEVETSLPALLVLNDSWDDGWEVFVDGIERTVLRANYAFRAVKVAQGRHHVAFRYRPRLLLAGMIMSITSLFATALLLATIRLWHFTDSRRAPQGQS